jgi:hypothetical protein
MRRVLALLLPGAFLALAVLLLLSLSPQRYNVRAQGTEHKLWAVFWSTEPGFTSTLEMKNNRIRELITAHIALYLADGAEVPLDPVTMGPRQTVMLNLNDIIRNLPPSTVGHGPREGTVEVEFIAPNASSVMGSVTVTNPANKIAWNFFLYPERPGLGPAPVRGVFWFPNRRTKGFVAVGNVTHDPVLVKPVFQIKGVRHPAPYFTIPPEQGVKFDLREALRHIGQTDATEGGIEFTYDGPPDAIRAHGVLYDEQGFSAELDFLRYDEFQEEMDFNYRTPRFAVGSADPVLGLPDQTTFRPNLVLHNFNGYRLDVPLAVGVKMEHGTREFVRTITLDPGETRVLEPRRAVLAHIPGDVHWASLEISYRGRHNGLSMMLVSTSHCERYSIRSVLNWVEATAREGWIWRADNQRTTLLGVFNSDVQDAKVAISLDYSDGGVTHSYDLPERTIPPRSTEMLDIGGIIAAHLPDKDGDIIPTNVSFGGYRVRKIGPTTGGNITTEALVFGRSGSPYLAVYNTGCCQYPPVIEPEVLSGQAGETAEFDIFAADICTGESIELTDDPQVAFSSTNPNVAFGDLLGTMHLVSPGSATVTARVAHPIPWNEVCRTQAEWSAPCFVSVNACATPSNFAQGAVTQENDGTLRIEYTWSSSSGNQSDLAKCKVGETVFYPGYPTTPYTWPLPMLAQSLNPAHNWGAGSKCRVYRSPSTSRRIPSTICLGVL